MQLTSIQESNTLLTYSLVTDPLPLQVSPSTTNPSYATLTFVVSCPKSIGSAMVSEILISLPVDNPIKGPDPARLAQKPPDKSDVSISSSGPEEWEVSTLHAKDLSLHGQNV